MPLDASIILQGRGPQFDNPLDVAQKAQSMRQMIRQNRLADQQDSETQSMREAFSKNIGQDGQVNRTGLMSEIYKINPTKAIELKNQFAEEDSAQSKAKMEKLRSDIDTMGRLAGSVKDQRTYEWAIGEAQKQGLDVSALPKSYDPQVVKAYQMRALSAKEQLDLEFKGQESKQKWNEVGLKRDQMAIDRQARADAKRPTAEQSKVAGFAQRLMSSEKIMDDLQASGFDGNDRRSWIEKNLFNEAKPVNLQKMEQAQRNFVNSVLRRESGAAISPEEFDSARLQYFPQAGDSQEVLEQKRQNRLDVMASLKAEAGDALSGVQNQRAIVGQEFPGKQSQQQSARTSGKPMTVVQNGHTYRLNPATGEYE